MAKGKKNNNNETQNNQQPQQPRAPRGGGGGGNPPSPPPRQPTTADILATLSGRVIGLDDSDSDRLVVVGGNSRPVTTYTASAVDRRLQALSPQPIPATPVVAPTAQPVPSITAQDLTNARVQGRTEFLENIRLARELCPVPTSPAPQTTTPAEKKDRVYGIVRDPKTGSFMQVERYGLSQQDFDAMNPAYLAGNRLEKRGFPGWAWALIALGLVGLVWLIASLASTPSGSDVKSANDAAAAWQQRALISEGAPRTISVGTVNAGAVTAGDVNAGDVTATGEVNVHNTVTRTVRTTNVVHEPAPPVTVVVEQQPVAPATAQSPVEDTTKKGTSSLTLKVKDSE